MKSYILILIAISSTFNGLTAQDKRTYKTQARIQDEIQIDGVLDEPIWQQIEWQSEFVQFQPYEGRKPSQKTEFALTYDDNFLYVAFKAWDQAPDSIVQRMTRRDDIDGDFVGVQFDSYYDQRTAFSFVASAAGVKLDFIVSNDGENEDESWNPVWWVKTSRTNEGWFCEMKIPFTQLRFENKGQQKWGFQVARNIFRHDEMNLWQSTSRTRNGWVSQYGYLTGLENIQSKLPFEVTPYVVARTDRFEKEVDNPFRDKGFSNSLNGGLDGKIGLTNNFTLDFSINPDFGQVEADPSQVNLTTQEVFFREQRPLFVEGKNILNFPLLFGDGDIGSENLFYSRRIGRSPQFLPSINDNEYLRYDKFSSILGAAKLTGKTQNGWSFGLLESLTAEEKAEIANSDGDIRKETIEPLTNYTVGRIQKDFNGGNTYLGGIFSSVNRDIDNPNLDFLHKSAMTGGIDFNHKFKDRTYQITFTNYFSKVNGSIEAIENTQTSFVRNYQRPDQTHKELDPTRTSLTGFGGKAMFGKISGNLNFLTALAWKSPGLELNDIGFMPETDQIFEVVWIGYRINEPFFIFRRIGINFNQWQAWSFGGEDLGPGGNINFWSNLKNQWNIGASYNINGEQIYTTALRGGPALLIPANHNQYVWISTGDQKKLSANLSLSRNRSRQVDYRKSNSYDFGISYQPTKTLKASISAEYYVNHNELQYVNQIELAADHRYLFGTIDQRVLSFSVRLNYNITPDLTIQFWGQPFIAAGEYSDFKYITDPRATHYSNRFHVYSPSEISFEHDEFTVQERNNGLHSYAFGNPDFNFKEFLSNLVVRWEYQPGSTVFLVWSQSRDHFIEQGNFNFNRDIDNLFRAPGENVLLVKLAHRLGR